MERTNVESLLCLSVERVLVSICLSVFCVCVCPSIESTRATGPRRERTRCVCECVLGFGAHVVEADYVASADT